MSALLAQSPRTGPSFAPQWGLQRASLHPSGRTLPPWAQAKPASQHHIGQCKGRVQVVRVLEQAAIAGLADVQTDPRSRETHAHPWPDAGLGLFEPVKDDPQRAVFGQSASLARHHGHMPAHIRVLALDLFTLVHAPIARIGKDIRLLAMQQGMRLGHIIDVGRRTHYRVHQARLRIRPDVGLHPEVTLVALLGLVHLGVALTRVVLGGAGRGNEHGVHDGALAHQQTGRARPGAR